jgi:mannose-6-phosphate isomerase-like protein (cupin superfamily)
MAEVFALDHSRLAMLQPHLAEKLSEQNKIDSRASFNRYCQRAIEIWAKEFSHAKRQTSEKFRDLESQIASPNDNVIKTGWGGVVVTLHEPPRVEKFLVIRRGGYLALEKHERKDEHLAVREGGGLILRRVSPNEPLAVEMLTPGATFHLAPGQEHCLIGAEDLLVFERSTDPKGMDRDLIFIYEPET